MSSAASSAAEIAEVAPFGYPRLTACVRLPAAFRSSLRPSSPPDAQASTVDPFVLPLRIALCASDTRHPFVLHITGLPRPSIVKELHGTSV